LTTARRPQNLPNSRVKAEVVFSNGLEFGDEEEFDLNGSQTDMGRMDAG
jgi:hypothetical protein